MGGSSSVLILLLAAFLLLSFVTGRLDWLKHLSGDAAARASGTSAPFGATGKAPTTAGGTT